MVGRNLCSLPLGSEEWWHWFTQMNPTHPLMLGLAARAFGPFAVYELPGVLGLGWLLATRRWIRHCCEGDRTLADAAVLGIPIVLFASSPYHVAYLMYPYREITSLFWTSLGLALFTQARDRRSTLQMVLSGVGLVLGAGGREVASVWFFAGLLFLLCDTKLDTTAKVALTLSLLAPAALAAAAWFFLPRIRFYQVAYYLEKVVSPESAGLAWSSRFAQYLGYLGASMGGAGWLLAVVGLWASREAWRWILCLVVAPALSMVLLYSFVGVHPRYAMHVLAVVSPLAGVGAIVVARWAARLARSFSRQAGESVVLIALALVSVGLAMRQCTHHRFTRRDIKTALEFLARWACTNDLFYTEVRNRYIPGLLTAYSPYRTLLGTCQDPRLPPTLAWAAGVRTWYVRPLDAEAMVRTPILDQGVRLREWLSYFGDLVRPDGGSEALVFTLGPYRFSLEEVRPFSARSMRTQLCASDSNSVIWLDFRSANADAEKVAWLEDDLSRRLHTFPAFRGTGLVPLLWPQSVSVTSVWLVVTSSVPLPANLVVTNCSAKSMAFRCDSERRVSLKDWFQPQFVLGKPEEKYVAALAHHGRLCIPAPVGTVGPRWTARVGIAFTAPPRSRGQAQLRVDAQGTPAVAKTIWLGQGHHLLEIAVSGQANTPAAVSFELRAKDAEKPVLRVSSILVEYLRPDL